MTTYQNPAATSEANASQRTDSPGAAFRERAQAAGQEVAHKVQEARHEMAHQAQELGEYGKEVVSEYYQQGWEQARAWREDLEHQLRDKPLQSLAIAGGIGLLLGLLLRR